jgi:nucleotide-binding universal stress UspA family protein
MSYATLMVHVDANFTRERIVSITCQLADKFSANIIGVSASPIPTPVIANGVIVNVATQDDIDQIRDRLQAKEDWFRQKAGAARRSISWRSELDFPTEFLIAQSCAADLVVVNPTREFVGAYNQLDAAGVILNAGRPVLVVPAEVRSLQADRIVIGWKGAREARRAIVDALPFMHEASRVTIAEVCEESDESAAQRGINAVVQYLAQHRINCESKIVLHPDGSIAARLVRLARDEGADLLVAGAYGHSRLGEWVFGGVTRELLATSPICCLMSH